MTDLLLSHEGAWMSVLAALLVLCSIFIVHRLWESAKALGGRWSLALLALSAAAIGLSAFWLPLFTRFEPLGHEATYADVFAGKIPPGTAAGGHEPYVTYPALRWAHDLLGRLAGRDHLAPLLWFHLAARGLAVLFTGLWVFALWGRRLPMVLAAAALVLHPTHAQWGAAVYNVAWPFALLCAAAWIALDGRGRSMPSAVAGVLCGTVVLLRVEWIVAGALLLTLSTVLLAFREAAVLARTRVVARFASAAFGPFLGLALLAFLHGGTLSSQGGYHDAAGYWHLVRHQWSFIRFIYPVGPLGIGLSFGIIAASALGWGRIPLLFLAAAVAHHLAMVTFNDVAPRHLLPAFLFLLPVVALNGQGGPWRSAHGLRGAFAVAYWLALGANELVDLRARYYIGGEAFEARHPEFQRARAPRGWLENSGCYLITDHEKTWAKGIAGSHFNLMDEAEAAEHWREWNGCVLWLYDLQNDRVDGLDVRPRAQKLEGWFRWQTLGAAELEDGTPVQVRWMTGPPWDTEGPPPRRPTSWTGT